MSYGSFRDGRASVELLLPANVDALLAALEQNPAVLEHVPVRDRARILDEFAYGSGYVFAVRDQGHVVGWCRLDHFEDEQTCRLQCWIDPQRQGQGFDAFAIGLVLEFAFRNRSQSAVWAAPECEEGLAENGFSRRDDGARAVARDQWIGLRQKEVLGALHPLLQAVLTAELAAGNEITETGSGWPDPDSVFVRLRFPFRARPESVPEGLSYSEPNDPHWWHADLSTRQPRHILAC